MSAPLHRVLDFDEYVAIDDNDIDHRYEFVAGHMHLMTGGTLRHARLIGRVFRAVTDHADVSGCRAYSSDARLRIGDDSYYPDVMVACGDESGDDRFEVAPCLLVEVLSPSSRVIDQREKLSAYTGMSSLDCYVLVHADAVLVEVHQRLAGVWTHRALTHGDTVELACPRNAVVDVDALYDGLLD